MIKEFFMFKELLRSLHAKTWALSFAIVLAVAVFLGTLAFFSLLLQPAASGAGVQLIAVPREDLSQADLAELHERLLRDPEILQVRYVFAPTVASNTASERKGAPSRFEISLRSDSELFAVAERLRGWGEFQQVGPPGPDSLEAWRDWLNKPEKRWIALAILASWLAIALFAIYGGLIMARRSFAGELELLELSGVPPQTLRVPFILLGALYGLTGALLVGFLFDGLRALMISSFRLFPELWESTVIDQLGVHGFLVGLAFAGVGGCLGWLTIQKYPSPFSRSRINSSSADVAVE
ncbi:MAG: hypothetical protein A2Z21_08725 [Candidatus Fraserbacteria bacterium RBG_16_55_9]|uniref:Cell division protein FtsX n=1 Tax=Fraserbacteria sp. (strain RBG_16_55_9) TaxID=1817864 RepID=A0A1F5V0C0_FRAXR|nr:MAG: hypothetical protein A2Z21_08725 [Candidatus Fraserbacteria bacterium RBG_16_55_9]